MHLAVYVASLLHSHRLQLAQSRTRRLTCRSTGRATAWHPGRAALVVYVAPRGQGPMPPRAGYLYVRSQSGLFRDFS